jgi:shikimate kinase
MQEIKKHGFSIYLDVPLEVLAQRVSKEANVRPLLNVASENLLTQITDRYKQREPFYKQANLTISGANLSVQDVLLWLNYMSKV